MQIPYIDVIGFILSLIILFTGIWGNIIDWWSFASGWLVSFFLFELLRYYKPRIE